jgi:hypothetical protein
MEGTLRLLFDRYDADGDGWLLQADFGRLLWDLKRCARTHANTDTHTHAHADRGVHTVR